MVTQQQSRRRNGPEEEDTGLTERTVRINRVSKVIKGGRHLSFSAMVVVGDGEGKVGIGMGKADAVPDAIKKGSTYAQKAMIDVPMKGTQSLMRSLSNLGEQLSCLNPPLPDRGYSGESVRAVVELAGIKDIVPKVRRSTNPTNVVKAPFGRFTKAKRSRNRNCTKKSLSKNELVVEQEESSQIED
ncbi:MAG: 30S ribosomal protein S5 [Chloroflexota bacterium]|nr:MAG: 30S ribosomal protein S5 [Chloroflexota bacterium]